MLSLDAIDRRILALLQADASLGTADIAERVGLTQPPCWRRVRRLEEAGLIQRRVCLLDAQKLGLNVTIFARIKLSAHGRQSLPEFEADISSFAEVLECYAIMGEYDFLLKIVTHDIEQYERFFRKHLSQMSTVQEVHSNVAMSTIKFTTELPLQHLEPR